MEKKLVFDICSVNIAKEIFDLQELCAFNSWNKFAGWYIAYDYYTLWYRSFGSSDLGVGGKSKLFSAEEPLKYPVDKFIDVVQFVG